jgi:hypothetical protein
LKILHRRRRAFDAHRRQRGHFTLRLGILAERGARDAEQTGKKQFEASTVKALEGHAWGRLGRSRVMTPEGVLPFVTAKRIVTSVIVGATRSRLRNVLIFVRMSA